MISTNGAFSLRKSIISASSAIFKISSSDITNIPFLRKIACTGKPVILSTGASKINEIDRAILSLRNAGCQDIALLHCILNYPTKSLNANLSMISSLKKTYPNHIIGYSDHTLGIQASLAAVVLGANIIEKHITIDKNLDGPDHKASIEPDQLKVLVKSIRNISLAMGSNEKKISKSELENLKIARKSIVAKVFIKKGQIFTEENLCTKRPAEGISPMEWDNIIGNKAKKDFQVDDFIEY